MKAYAHRSEESGNAYFDIYPSKLQVGMCGDEEIHEVNVREVKDGEKPTHWCWQDTGREDFSMIFPRMILLEVCFPYGVEAATKAGKGRVCEVIVEPA